MRKFPFCSQSAYSFQKNVHYTIIYGEISVEAGGGGGGIFFVSYILERRMFSRNQGRHYSKREKFKNADVNGAKVQNTF